jgi:CRP-like cAMP-binding protein
MRPMHVAAGVAIFRAGEPSLAVYVIDQGEVAISVGDVTRQTEVARLHAGELFGESGVLEARARAATATAIVATTLVVTSGVKFLRAFGSDNDSALTLLKILCRRLRSTTLRAIGPAEASSSPGATAQERTARCDISLSPNHERLTTEFGMASIDVRSLPYRVGNRYGGETLPIASTHNFCIQAHGEADLAAPHFEILRRDGRLGVRDLGSPYGTIVNGVGVTRTSGDPFVPLHAGDNDVIAGRVNSPFRFRLVCREGVRLDDPGRPVAPSPTKA